MSVEDADDQMVFAALYQGVLPMGAFMNKLI